MMTKSTIIPTYICTHHASDETLSQYDFVRENQYAENYSEIDVTLQVEIAMVDSESAYLQT